MKKAIKENGEKIDKKDADDKGKTEKSAKKVEDTAAKDDAPKTDALKKLKQMDDDNEEKTPAELKAIKKVMAMKKTEAKEDAKEALKDAKNWSFWTQQTFKFYYLRL